MPNRLVLPRTTAGQGVQRRIFCSQWFSISAWLVY